MRREPEIKRAMAFIDASNTRAAAKRAFGEGFGNFNPVALAEDICRQQGWTLAGISYYLGVPDVRVTEDGHYSWMKRCMRWRKQGVHVYTRTLLQDEQGTAREKGIDVRLALDAVRLFREGAYDVAIICSQDQDFSELVAELRAIAREGSKWLHLVSAFPTADKEEPRGIAGTYPIALHQEAFRAVLDTPENRKRIHQPLVTSLRDRPKPPAEGAWHAASSASEIGITAKQAPAAAPRTSRWAAIAASLYLAGALLTFGEMSWTSRANLMTPEQALPTVALKAANALVWPAYWLEGEKMRALKSRFAARNAADHAI